MLLFVFFNASYPRGVNSCLLVASLTSGRVLTTGLVSAPLAILCGPKLVILKLYASVTALTVAF